MEIKLEKKLFQTAVRHNLRNNILISLLVLSLFSIILFLFFNRYFQGLHTSYRDMVINNLQGVITEINNSGAAPEEKLKRFQNAVNSYIKNKFIISIWLGTADGQIILHSAYADINTNPPLQAELKLKYKYIFSYLFTFQADGRIIPLVENKAKNDYLEVFFPVFSAENKKAYLAGIQFHKYLSRMIYVKPLEKYVNIIYVGLIGLGFFLLFLAAVFIILFAQTYTRKLARLRRELMQKLHEINLNELPLQFPIKDYNLKHNFVADFVTYVNHLLEQFKIKLDETIQRQDAIKAIQPPILYHQPVNAAPVQVYTTPDKKNLRSFLWESYFKDSAVQDFKGWSTGVYHYHKEQDADTVFKYFNASREAKGFFMARIMESDADKKILLLSALNFALQNYRENIDKADGFLAALNSMINRIGKSMLGVHASYLVLNTETNYVQVASTKFSPCIYFNAESNEFRFYTFDSVPLGKRGNDEFLQELQKEVFKLSDNDFVLVCDPQMENAFNHDQDRYDTYRLTDIIRQYANAGADVVVDKFRADFDKFSLDFTKLHDLLLFLLKKSGHETK